MSIDTDTLISEVAIMFARAVRQTWPGSEPSARRTGMSRAMILWRGSEAEPEPDLFRGDITPTVSGWDYKVLWAEPGSDPETVMHLRTEDVPGERTRFRWVLVDDLPEPIGRTLRALAANLEAQVTVGT